MSYSINSFKGGGGLYRGLYWGVLEGLLRGMLEVQTIARACWISRKQRFQVMIKNGVARDDERH